MTQFEQTQSIVASLGDFIRRNERDAWEAWKYAALHPPATRSENHAAWAKSGTSRFFDASINWRAVEAERLYSARRDTVLAHVPGDMQRLVFLSFDTGHRLRQLAEYHPTMPIR